MRSLAVLCCAALSYALAQTTLIPALGQLAEDLDTTATGVAWTLTAYLVAAAVATPLFGRLGDMFGKRRLLVISLVLFAAGSAVAAAGSSLEWLIAGRVLQGAGGGIFPLCFGIIRDEFPRERVASSIGLISATFGIGGGTGLILGGVLIDNASYHWIFWVGAASGIVAAGLVQLLIPESPVRTPGRVDLRGAAVLAVGLVLPLVAISQAHSWGWASARTLGLIAAGLAILAAWVSLERRTREPLANIELLSRPAVAMTNVASLLVGFAMFGSFLLTPQLLEADTSTGYGFGLSATSAGLIMLPGALVMLFAGPLSGSLGSRFGPKLPLALGAAVSAAGLAGMAFAHDTQLGILLSNVVLSIGIGLSFAAMANLIVIAVPRENTGEATGLNTVVRSVGSSLGSQVCASIVASSVVLGTGVATDDGYTNAYLVSAGVSAVAALIAVLVPRPRHVESESPAAVAAVAAAPERG